MRRDYVESSTFEQQRSPPPPPRRTVMKSSDARRDRPKDVSQKQMPVFKRDSNKFDTKSLISFTMNLIHQIINNNISEGNTNSTVIRDETCIRDKLIRRRMKSRENL